MEKQLRNELFRVKEDLDGGFKKFLDKNMCLDDKNTAEMLNLLENSSTEVLSELYEYWKQNFSEQHKQIGSLCAEKAILENNINALSAKLKALKQKEEPNEPEIPKIIKEEIDEVEKLSAELEELEKNLAHRSNVFDSTLTKQSNKLEEPSV